MQASYQLAEKDLLEAQTAHAGSLFRIGQVFGAFSIAAGLGELIFARSQYPQALAAMALGLFFLFRLRFSAKLSFKRDFASQGMVQIAVSQSGIQFSSVKGTGDLNWDAFVRYTETKNLFVLYLQSRLLNIIPKRAFTPQDLPQFRQSLQRNLTTKSASHARRFSPRLVVFLAVVLVVAIMLGVVLVRSKG
jgi:hypothetical protein